MHALWKEVVPYNIISLNCFTYLRTRLLGDWTFAFKKRTQPKDEDVTNMEAKLTKVMVIYFMSRIEYNSFIGMVTTQSQTKLRQNTIQMKVKSLIIMIYNNARIYDLRII